MQQNSKGQKEQGNPQRSAGPVILQRFGATRPGVWVIKHLVSPLDRWLYQRTGGRRVSTGKSLGPLLLLTTTGRRSGKARTTPVFFLRDDDQIIVCNVNPGFESPNPWTLNLRANPTTQVQIGPERGIFRHEKPMKQRLSAIGRNWFMFGLLIRPTTTGVASGLSSYSLPYHPCMLPR